MNGFKKTKSITITTPLFERSGFQHHKRTENTKWLKGVTLVCGKVELYIRWAMKQVSVGRKD